MGEILQAIFIEGYIDYLGDGHYYYTSVYFNNNSVNRISVYASEEDNPNNHDAFYEWCKKQYDNPDDFEEYSRTGVTFFTGTKYSWYKDDVDVYLDLGDTTNDASLSIEQK